MRRMANRKYLDPAHSLILKFGGPDGKLSQGIDAVAAITGADRTRVYRWMRPQDKGGTGGMIPNRQADKLLAYAKKRRLPIEPGDFFGTARAA